MPSVLQQGPVDTLAWANGSSCAMQDEALLPRLFYMREWLTYGCVVAVHGVSPTWHVLAQGGRAARVRVSGSSHLLLCCKALAS